LDIISKWYDTFWIKKIKSPIYWTFGGIKMAIKSIFVICTVRGAPDEYKKKLEDYVEKLEQKGYFVHLPHRDTNQDATGYSICSQNRQAIELSDEVHVFYNGNSQGTHFDLGMAFALDKQIIVVENEEIPEKGKSFPRMIKEWEEIYK
jgi:hypothetical protein